MDRADGRQAGSSSDEGRQAVRQGSNAASRAWPGPGDVHIATAAEGALLQGAAQVIKIGCSFAGVVVLARLLAPQDFGIVAMAAPFVGFLALFQNLGLSEAAVQARRLDDRQATALFIYNLAAACILGLILLATAPLVARFYGVPEVGAIAAFSSLSLLVAALSMQHAAWGSRQMRFGLLSAAEVLASVVGLLATIVLAVWLRSFWALVIGPLAGALAMTLLLWLRVPWKPVRDVDFAGTREMFAFGASLTGFSVVNFMVRNLDNVLIGKAWGAGQLGLYDRSYRIMMFPIQSINAPLGRVLLPTLARLRDQPERYRRAYTTAIGTLALVAMPGVLAAAICSEEVVRLLLGPGWGEAAPIFRWLSLAALLSPITHTTGWLFISSDRGAALFRWGLLSGAVTLSGFVVGLPWGAEGVALSFVVTQVALLPALF